VQTLLRVRRVGHRFVEDHLGEVRFVPLIGAEGWPVDTSEAPDLGGGTGSHEGAGGGAADLSSASGARFRSPAADGSRAAAETLLGAERAPARAIPPMIGALAEPFSTIEHADLSGLLERIGSARLVLLGEATHGTSEFYRMRARITRELVERRGFTVVALEADWPDAARVDAWVRGYPPPQPGLRPFSRFPTWMWRNEEFRDFVEWLREHNESRPETERVGLFGLDLYSVYASVDAVLRYLDDVDPEAALSARARYGCLTPWSRDPAAYGRAALAGRYRECEDDVVSVLGDLLSKRLELEAQGERRFFDAERNARLVASAERYYRVMYYGSHESWNLRDRHMFDTLLALLGQRAGTRAVVWAHNSHLGDASATEMGASGEHNVGQLARERFGREAYLVGFGTHTGTVAAAGDWGAPVHVMRVAPSHERSYERLCHETDPPTFLLPLRRRNGDELRSALSRARLERAIGVVYRPDTELQSHYFHASLPAQFDEWVWFDESQAVAPLTHTPGGAPAETFPFGV
jgi:protein-L-isoaspartate(D-aspartate) O-methyltransferase